MDKKQIKTHDNFLFKRENVLQIQKNSYRIKPNQK